VCISVFFLSDMLPQDPLCDPAMLVLFTEHRDDFDAKVREFVKQVGLIENSFHILY
jgi:hypothetical protein